MGFVLALAGAVPALGLMWWVGRYDARRPEPARLLRRVAVWGGLAVFPTIVVELLLASLGPRSGLGGALWTAFVVAALTEETFKALTLWWLVWRHPAFDERLDGIVYATRAGLGFALVENIAYLLGERSTGGALAVFVLRAALAVPGHAIYAGFMGYWAARRRFDRVGPGLLGGLAIAIALHGAYDAGLFLAPEVVALGLPWLAVPLVAVPLLVVVLGYRRLHAHALEALRLDDLAAHRALHASAPLRAGFSLEPPDAWR